MLYEQAVLWLDLTLQFQAVIARHYKGYICKCKAFARDKLPVQFKLVYQPEVSRSIDVAKAMEDSEQGCLLFCAKQLISIISCYIL